MNNLSFFSSRLWCRVRAMSVAFILLFSLFIIGGQVFAQGSADPLGVTRFDGATVLGGQDIRVIIARIINIFLGLLGVIAVSIVLYGGFVYMTSNGDEGRVSDARRIIINGVIGLVIILASYSISLYVLNRLREATGVGDANTVAQNCQDLLIANDPRYAELCGQSGGLDCTSHPEWCCGRQNFVVQGITPRTDATNMNNATIRVVFSQGVSTAANNILSITRDGASVNDQFQYAFTSSDRKVLEATYIGNETCANGNRCLPSGQYRVTVGQDVSSDTNSAITDNPGCGSFPLEADFQVNTTGVRDTETPVISDPMTVAGVREIDQSLAVDQTHTVRFSVTDNTGIGYVRLSVAREGQSENTLEYQVPSVNRGSDAPSGAPYDYSFPLVLASNTPVRERYVLTATVFDIDGNSQMTTSSFVTVASHCGNGIQDGNETDVDTNGSCLGMGSCTADWQCSSHQCVSGQCVASPLITSVDPWDGAAGNFITLEGRYFGQTPGTIDFGVDRNRDGVLSATEWVRGTVAVCGGVSSWYDTWAIVTVPGDDLPVGSTSTIRLTRGDNTTFFDTTNNNRGLLGLFTKNTVFRPQLCRVETGNGGVEAVGATPVRAIGSNFGTTQDRISFGRAGGAVTSWSENEIRTIVPESLQAGRVGVTVGVGDEVSKAVPFTVLAPEENVSPVIDRIDPPTTTRGSYVTVGGRGFGASVGTVFLHENRDTECTVGSADCILAGIPDACIDNWGRTQIVIEIPRGAQVDRAYYLTVRNAAGFSSISSEPVHIIAGSERPGICSIEPNEGPAPRPPASPNLIIRGNNFSSTSTVFFWTTNARPDDVGASTWLASRPSDVSVSGTTRIATPIPVTDDGLTMQTGPIHVSSRGQISNGVLYTVTDCRETGIEPSGLHCCPDGTLRPDSFACDGEVREAGYVWRFTTGHTPRLPSVIESCASTTTGAMPSPTPWQGWRNTGMACMNAEIRVRFSMPMDAATIAEGVKVYTCGTGITADCVRSKVDVTSDFDIVYESQVLRAIRRTSSRLLQANTWYHIELLSSISSQEDRVILGHSETVRAPLQRTRPCGGTTAYCFDFQTDARECTLRAVGIQPPTHLTTILGMVQDPRYPLSFADPFSVPHPLYYYAWGAADRACTVIPVDGYGWEWTSAQVAEATVTVSPSLPRYTDSRATVIARAQTPGVSLRVVSSTPQGLIQGESTLVVNLGTPRVVDFWPNCVESCVNAGIGLQFNQVMVTSTYREGVSIHECSDPLCTVYDQTPIAVDVVEASPMVYRLAPRASLNTDQWYVVFVRDSIRAMTALGDATLGNRLEEFSWRFKTKATDGICVAASVIVNPSMYVAHAVGERTLYSALPISSPNQCSSRGQELNPWGYGWEWASRDTRVATVSDFSTVAAPRPQCTNTCLPRGSTIARTQDVPVLCGNGVVDPGEDCDLAASFTNSNNRTEQESLGTSCTIRCLRPGNSLSGIGNGQCGNGRVEPEVGEQCDPAVGSAGARTCTAQCLFAGSAETATPEVLSSGVTYCGDGVIADGEACEPGLNGEIRGVTCSNSCLHRGVGTVSQAWCDAYATEAYEQTTVERSAACRESVSVCGNGIVERGEDCERINVDSGGLVGDMRLFGSDALVEVSNVGACDVRCRLVNICNEENIPTTVRCNPTEEGCDSASCIRRGSSIQYEQPSLCGDAVVGVGEAEQCEYSEEERSRAVDFGQDPVQVVTAIGAGDVNPNTGYEETVIAATAVRTENQSSINISGEGDYSLQCGFVEYTDNTPRSISGATVPVFNNCPQNIQAAQNGDTDNYNRYGAGTNSCCTVRPSRSAEFPIDGSGIPGTQLATEDVCRNTAISVTLNGEIDEETVDNNILIARGYVGAVSCPGSETNNITSLVNATLAYVENVPQGSLWDRVWFGVKTWIDRLFGGRVFASQYRPNISTWCVDDTIPVVPAVRYEEGADASIKTVIDLKVQQAMESNTVYAVILRGGVDGVRDTAGVPIRPQGTEYTNPNDSWVFRTGREICKIDHLSVIPASYLFTTPNSSTLFAAEAVATGNRRIVPIPSVYDWSWQWGPVNHPIFAIPTASTPSNESEVTIASRSVEGRATGFVQARITADQTASQNQPIGTVFSQTLDLTANFCERPWPIAEYYPYEDGYARGEVGNNDGYVNGRFDGSAIPAVSAGGQDGYFYFSLGYCADAGRSGDVTDDLPYLRPVVLTNQQPSSNQGGVSVRLPQETLKQFLFFNDINDDAIGIQIFSNPDRISARAWYEAHFGSSQAFRTVLIDGYEGISDGNSVYIHGLSAGSVRNDVSSFIFLVSINKDAQVTTRNVFDQLISSLAFNINIPNVGYCSVGDGSVESDIFTPDAQSIACTTDFDCASLGADRVCANARTKLQRDWQRLADASRIIDLSSGYLERNGRYPSLLSGTYIQRYTNSRWPSWGTTLSPALAGPQLPLDPVNMFTSCPNGGDEQTCWNQGTSQFSCPARASVYEYYVDADYSDYTLHIPFEYFRGFEGVVSQVISQPETHLTYERWCAPTTVVSPTPGQCGNGVVNAGEQCDPPGTRTITTVQYGQRSSGVRYCDYALSTTQCTANTDCAVSRFTFNGDSTYYVAAAPSTAVCVARDGSLIYKSGSNPFQDKQILPYVCVNYAECVSQVAADPNWSSQTLPNTLSPRPDTLEVSCAPLSSALGYDGVSTAQDPFATCVASSSGINMSCPVGQVTLTTCTSECQLSSGQCQIQHICGNGIVETGETCDDGILNGTYGHCAGESSISGHPELACQALHPQFCGNGTLDSDRAGRPLEYCEKTQSTYTTGYCQKNSCSTPQYVETRSTIAGVVTLNAVHVVNETKAWAVGTRTAGGGVIYSWNGRDWVLSHTETGAILWGVHFFDANRGWAVGTRGANTALVLRTVDGGRSWTSSEIATGVSLRSVYFTNQSTGVAVGYGNNIFRSDDGGVTWQSISVGINNAASVDFNAVTFSSASVGWAVSVQGDVYRTNDGGQSWSAQGNVSVQQGTSLRDVHFVNSQLGYIVGTNSTMLRTVNGGLSWASLQTPSIVGGRQFTSIHFVTTSNAIYGVATGELGRGVTTLDGGETWGAQSTVGGLNSIAMINPNRAIAVGNGGVVADFVVDPYCVDSTMCTANSECSNGDPCITTSTPTYHINRQNSCAFDCQSVGGYCGDGVVNQSYEQCDDGNRVDTDACSNFCFVRNPINTFSPPPSVGCGNGTVDTGEQCDNGSDNGVTCSTQYGQRCSYCSTQCRTVTVDPVSFCGDGRVDAGNGEVCDTLSSGAVTVSAQGDALVCNGGTALESVSRGQYSCTNNCRRLENTCGVCGQIEFCSATASSNPPGICTDGIDNDGDGLVDTADFTAGGAEPRYAVINPMVSNANGLTDPWGQQTRIDFLRFADTIGTMCTASGNSSSNGSIFNPGIGVCADARWIRSGGFIGSRDLVSGSVAYSTESTAIANVTPNLINSNQLCGSVYTLDVNGQYVSSIGGVQVQGQSSIRGDLFPYPVSGEAPVVQNEYVLSPAVPEDVFRVVVRWTDLESNANAQFIGRLYSDAFTANSRIADLTYAQALGTVCDQSARTAFGGVEYWWPSGCQSFENTVFVHPRINLSRTYVQSMTIDARNAEAPFAFFVDEVNRPLDAFTRSAGLRVEVYTYHEGQSPLESVYLPRVFEIRQADQSTNTNVQYWHVFNLRKNVSTGHYEIETVGSSDHGAIATGQAQVLSQL